MFIRYKLLGLLLCATLGAFSQTNVLSKSTKGLNIGERMPDVEISGIKNYHSSVLRFSELKSKLVILDFWFGACKGCIQAFPKMEFLQQKYKDQIQIIMVNFETQSKIDSTFKKWSKLSSIYRNPKLPSIVGDTVLHRLFTFEYYPHEVWINEEGKIIGFTSSEEVNEKNIAAALNHAPMDMDMKIDFISYNDYKYPLFSQVYSVYPDRLKYYSIVMDFIPGVSGGISSSIEDSVANTVRLTRKNMSLLELFCEAVTKGLLLSPMESAKFDYGKRVHLQVDDPSKYIYSEKTGLTQGRWRKENCITYESVMPISQKEELYANMLSDLTRTFNITCTIEKQPLKCFALVRTSGIDKLSAKKKGISAFDPAYDTTKVQLYSGRIGQLVDAVSEANKHSPYLFADDTGYDALVDIELPRNALSNLKVLNKLLSKYDLVFVEKILPMEILILKENGSNK